MTLTKCSSDAFIKSAIITILCFLHSSCVSVSTQQLPPESFRSQLINLFDTCQMTKKSGFVADLSISSQGSMRVEAAWDNSGNLNGQIVNALGEDLLNFRIDTAGQLETDTTLSDPDTLSLTLEFLAELGSSKTRLLVCSGLYLVGRDYNKIKSENENQETNFTFEKRGLKWFLTSKISSITPSPLMTPEQMKISTRVSSQNYLFKKSVANIEWMGEQRNKRLVPRELMIRTLKTTLKLSFLDFD